MLDKFTNKYPTSTKSILQHFILWIPYLFPMIHPFMHYTPIAYSDHCCSRAFIPSLPHTPQTLFLIKHVKQFKYKFYNSLPWSNAF